MPTTKNKTQHIAICVRATTATCRTRGSIEIYAAHVCAFVFERVPTVPAAARRTRARVPISHINEICPGRGAGTELAFNYIIKQLRESIQPMPRRICPHTHTHTPSSVTPPGAAYITALCVAYVRVYHACGNSVYITASAEHARAREFNNLQRHACVRQSRAERSNAEPRRVFAHRTARVSASPVPNSTARTTNTNCSSRKALAYARTRTRPTFFGGCGGLAGRSAVIALAHGVERMVFAILGYARAR